MTTPEEYLAATDPRMAQLIARSLRYSVKPGKLIRPFDALAESIAYQQLSGKAAATIWKRVRALYPRRKYLDPKEILETPDEMLRAAGLSRRKVAVASEIDAKMIFPTLRRGTALSMWAGKRKNLQLVPPPW